MNNKEGRNNKPVHHCPSWASLLSFWGYWGKFHQQNFWGWEGTVGRGLGRG